MHTSLDHPPHIVCLGPTGTSTDLNLDLFHRRMVDDIALLTVADIAAHIILTTTIHPPRLSKSIALVVIPAVISTYHHGPSVRLMKLIASSPSLSTRLLRRAESLPTRYLSPSEELWILTVHFRRSPRS
jgi:hypothetical protein